ncbi:Cullin-4B [Venturia inaequalis]|nr:Cullin-4B [Venturia inaequalis]
MKLLCLLFVSLLTTSVSAKKHRLCCCAGFNACNQFVCDHTTRYIAQQSKGEFIMSTKSWEKSTGSPCGGIDQWMYSSDEKGKGDGYIGGALTPLITPSFRVNIITPICRSQSCAATPGYGCSVH